MFKVLPVYLIILISAAIIAGCTVTSSSTSSGSEVQSSPVYPSSTTLSPTATPAPSGTSTPMSTVSPTNAKTASPTPTAASGGTQVLTPFILTNGIYVASNALTVPSGSAILFSCWPYQGTGFTYSWSGLINSAASANNNSPQFIITSSGTETAYYVSNSISGSEVFTINVTGQATAVPTATKTVTPSPTPTPTTIPTPTPTPVPTITGTQIRVACIGDSITAGLAVPLTENYPALLGSFLGQNYVVSNFGVSGTSAITDFPYLYPYQWEPQYTNSINWDPNIVTIMLGANDSSGYTWNPAHYSNDYLELIRSYQSLPSHPEIILCTPTYMETNTCLQNTVVDGPECVIVRALAADTGALLADVNTAASNMPDYFWDGVHPDYIGDRVVAETIMEQCFNVNFEPLIPYISGRIMLGRNGWTAGSDVNPCELPERALAAYSGDTTFGARFSTGYTNVVGPQVPGQNFIVNMQSSQTFTTIEMANYWDSGCYPVSYSVYVSSDGVNWGNAVAGGNGSQNDTIISFPSQTAQYIEIVQTGSGPDNWNIEDFRVYE